MLVESALAFVLIVAAASLIYVLGRRAAPKPAQSQSERAVYACGEKVTFPKLKVNVSLYKYLIYFIVLDSSVLLVAYASFVGQAINFPLIIVYLLLMLAAGYLLLEGGKDE
ncbi:MAG: NADH-quinone oxidoreductase subunit A [Candidatus Bathyarchaeia archaeon]